MEYRILTPMGRTDLVDEVERDDKGDLGNSQTGEWRR